MAATLSQSKIYTMHGGEHKSGADVTVVYFVNITSPTVPQQVLELAQGASSGDKVPQFGDSFAETIDAVDHVDDAIIVDSIATEQREAGPGGGLKWKITVVYRNPTLTQSQPEDVNQSPETREARFWTESLTITEDRDTGKNQQPIKWPWTETNSNFGTTPAPRVVDTKGPVTNAAGERFGGADRIKRRLPIFVYKKNVLSPFAWISVNNDFEAKTNAAAWDIFGQSISKPAAPETCLFWSIETSRPMYWGSVVYYEFEVRVLYDPNKHLISVPNEGSRYWEVIENEELGKKTSNLATPYANGQPIQPPIILNADGGLRSDQSGVADLLTFKDLETADFDQLNAAVTGVS